MTAKPLMIQGTASSVGKSVLVAALCRILKQDGWRVAPFKAQNMSLNSFVTPDGREIGRAQAVQAEAAGVDPTVEMNPILLKPEADDRSQVVVKGRPLGRETAKDYYSRQKGLWSVVRQSLDRLLASHDVVVIEGAGSPAEINLRDRDMVNMRVASYCRAPVFLAADIDRGGMFASVVGTLELLPLDERSLVKGIVINKFRGDLSLLEPGLQWLAERTGIPVVGVIPYIHDLRVAEEDSLSPERRRATEAKKNYVLDIAVIGLPHISNFDDFDPLEQEDGVRLRYVDSNDELGEPDLVIIPGTKSTMADLAFLHSRGLAQGVVDRANRGTFIIGVCGGYQMLGRTILDPQRVESDENRAQGLGLLPVTTTFSPVKSTHQVRGSVVASSGWLQEAAGLAVAGYEIHMGTTSGNNGQALFRIDERSRRACQDFDGCVGPDGNVLGTYLHGLFHNTALRRFILSRLAARKGAAFHPTDRIFSKEEHYDKLADLVRSSLDMERIYRAIGVE
jgi:adenosylcobyric acid synthase